MQAARCQIGVIGGAQLDPYVSLSRILWFLHPKQVAQLNAAAFAMATTYLRQLPESDRYGATESPKSPFWEPRAAVSWNGDWHHSAPLCFATCGQDRGAQPVLPQDQRNATRPRPIDRGPHRRGR